MRVIVSGGGSAGHISPALAVCDALKQLDPEVELLYVGEQTGLEARIVAAAGWPFAAIKAGKFRRQQGVSASRIKNLFNPQTLGLNARDALRVSAGISGSLKILRRFKPDVVFLKGGFVCLPVGLAARLLHIPYVLHESDVTPGLTNRILTRWAQKIAVGFPVASYPSLPAARLVYTGSPVRNQITAAHRFEGLSAFHLNDQQPVVLITGGSQGATQINDCVIGSLAELLPNIQIIHQTGDGELSRVKFVVKRLRLSGDLLHNYHPFAFLIHELPLALAAADIVVGRAGVGTITDSATLGKPTVLIPNYQMAGHQMANARLLARSGAVHVLNGEELTPDLLVAEIRRLLADPDEQGRLSRAIREYARPNAALDVARLVVAAGQGRDNG